MAVIEYKGLLMKMYKTGGYRNPIEGIDVIRATEKSVFLKDTSHREKTEMREAKITQWYCRHNTWEEAKSHLLNQATEKVKSLRLQLQRATDKLGNIKGLKEDSTND